MSKGEGMHSMGGNCSRDGALKNMGVQFRIDMAFRLVKRNEEGKPVNPRELELARSVLAWARANGVKPGARRTGRVG